MAQKKYKKHQGKFYIEIGDESEYEDFLIARKERIKEERRNHTNTHSGVAQELLDLDAEEEHIDEELEDL